MHFQLIFFNRDKLLIELEVLNMHRNSRLMCLSILFNQSHRDDKRNEDDNVIGVYMNKGLLNFNLLHVCTSLSSSLKAIEGKFNYLFSLS